MSLDNVQYAKVTLNGITKTLPRKRFRDGRPEFQIDIYNHLFYCRWWRIHMETGPRVLEEGRAHPAGVENVWLKELDSQLATIEDEGGELVHPIRTIGTQQEEVILKFYLSEPDEESDPTATFPRAISSNAGSDISEVESGAGHGTEKQNSVESESDQFFSSQTGGERVSEKSAVDSNREKSLVVSDRKELAEVDLCEDSLIASDRSAHDMSAAASVREKSVPFSDHSHDNECTFPHAPPTEPAGDPAGPSTFLSNASIDKESVGDVPLKTDGQNIETVSQNEDCFDSQTQFHNHEEKEPFVPIDKLVEDATDISEQDSGTGLGNEKENSVESVNERFFSSQSGEECVSKKSVVDRDREKSVGVSDREKSVEVGPCEESLVASDRSTRVMSGDASDHEKSLPFSSQDNVLRYQVPTIEPAGEPAGLSSFLSNVSSEKAIVEKVPIITDAKNSETVIQNEESFYFQPEFLGNEEKEPNVPLNQLAEDTKHEKEESPERDVEEFSGSPSSTILIPPPVPEIMSSHDSDHSPESAKGTSEQERRPPMFSLPRPPERYKESDFYEDSPPDIYSDDDQSEKRAEAIAEGDWSKVLPAAEVSQEQQEDLPTPQHMQHELDISTSQQAEKNVVLTEMADE